MKTEIALPENLSAGERLALLKCLRGLYGHLRRIEVKPQHDRWEAIGRVQDVLSDLMDSGAIADWHRTKDDGQWRLDVPGTRVQVDIKLDALKRAHVTIRDPNLVVKVRPCPVCDHQNDHEATTCHHCGRDLEEVETGEISLVSTPDLRRFIRIAVRIAFVVGVAGLLAWLVRLMR